MYQIWGELPQMTRVPWVLQTSSLFFSVIKTHFLYIYIYIYHNIQIWGELPEMKKLKILLYE